jgi:hypothetical protein
MHNPIHAHMLVHNSIATCACTCETYQYCRVCQKVCERWISMHVNTRNIGKHATTQYGDQHANLSEWTSTANSTVHRKASGVLVLI